jgi:hypothetical protein
MPLIGPINGDISMAPMMTAVEFVFNPTEAIIIAKTKTHRLVPLKIIPFLIDR